MSALPREADVNKERPDVRKVPRPDLTGCIRLLARVSRGELNIRPGSNRTTRRQNPWPKLTQMLARDFAGRDYKPRRGLKTVSEAGGTTSA